MSATSPSSSLNPNTQGMKQAIGKHTTPYYPHLLKSGGDLENQLEELSLILPVLDVMVITI